MQGQGSIRGLGHTLINVDKPLRSDLKAQAAARGVTMVEYLRQLAAQAAKEPIQTKGWQGAPGLEPSQNEHALSLIHI